MILVATPIALVCVSVCVCVCVCVMLVRSFHQNQNVMPGRKCAQEKFAAALQSEFKTAHV